MAEMDRNKNGIEKTCSIQNNNKALQEGDSKSFSLLGRFDGQTIIQAVVFSELLGKPKAKRRKRGYLYNENINSR